MAFDAIHTAAPHERAVAGESGHAAHDRMSHATSRPQARRGMAVASAREMTEGMVSAAQRESELPLSRMPIQACSNSEQTYVVWQPAQPIEDCRGFALYRKTDGVSDAKPLPTTIGWEGENAPSGTRRPSDEWPIQKFKWSDFSTESGHSYSYRAVPMVGTDHEHLRARFDLASPWSNTVETSQEGPLTAHFNRGIVMSQAVARQLPAPQDGGMRALKEEIATPGSELRNFLSGNLRTTMLGLLDKTNQEGGQVYLALFEANDPELIDGLKALGPRAHVVLSNGCATSRADDRNQDVRTELREGGVDVQDRMLASGHLGHNKFMVMTDAHGDPQSVWTGSTNWTQTGLNTQSNNGLLIAVPEIANQYAKQWDLLVAEGDGQSKEMKALNSEPKQTELPNGSKVSVWFTPTEGQPDLEMAREKIHEAKEGVLFLMFNPGPRGSLLNTILDESRERQDLHVQGVINQDPSTKKTAVTFYQRGEAHREPTDIVMPAGIKEDGPYLQKEFSRGDTFGGGLMALVHSKVVVIDPFGEHPVVMTGSHNYGPKGSERNDENFVIVEGDRKLAEAYAVNIMSVYNQYRGRYAVAKAARDGKPFQGLKDSDAWQDPYFSEESRLRESSFWLKQARSSCVDPVSRN